jgi:hypothetical protein
LAKDSRHPFCGEKVFFATKHSKENVLAPILAKLGMECIRLDVDTDLFGTFSGEVERAGTIRETLRMKISEAAKIRPEARFFLASEGSFGPHPLFGFLRSDHEALLLIDRQEGTEIYVEEVSTETNHAEIDFGPRDDLNGFLKQIGFPEHGLIVKTVGDKPVVYKDLRNFHAVGQAMLEAFQASRGSKVLLMTDMRACFNPTRMKVIEEVGEKLAEALASLCPSCETPGFSIRNSVPGLPCEECGEATRATKHVIFNCVKCGYTEEKERPDGLRNTPASGCDFCNP